jgi:hypothetical protein
MALNKNVSLTNYDAQLAAAQRQQKLAEMLQEQANAPIDVQSYKGVQAAIPWTAVLAKALQGGLAGYEGKKADEQKAAIGEQTRKGLSDYLQQSSANYKIPNIQASPLMKEEQVRQPMAQPVGLQSMAPPVGITNGMVQTPDRKNALAAALAAQTTPPVAAPIAQAAPPMSAPQPDFRQELLSRMQANPGNYDQGLTQADFDKAKMAQPAAAPSPIASAMGPQSIPQGLPKTISVPDMTPQPAMINRPAADRQQMVLQGIASDNPLIRQVAPSMYDQATKDVAKENMASAIKAIDIGDADPAVIKLYMESENPSGAIDYLSKFGMAKTEAKAKMDELAIRLAETANQDEKNRLSRESIAAQTRASIEANSANSRALTASIAGLTNNRAVQGQVLSTRKEFDNLPEVKNFKSISQAYKDLQSAAGKPSAAGDLSVIFGYMKMLDPTSVVREGEQASAANATGVPANILNIYNKVAKGQRLNPGQRQDFLNQANLRYQNNLQRHNEVVQTYSGYANQIGVDPKNVVGNENYNFNPAGVESTGAPAAVGGWGKATVKR